MFVKKAFFAISFFCATSLFALQVPELTGRVNDYANVISYEDKAEISQYLANLENSTSIQMVVLTIPSLEGDDIEEFSNRTAEKWQIGQKDSDNGALLVVSMAERKIRIETGYGLEGKLTDTKCGLIIRNVIAPEFQKGNYSKGIFLGVQNMGGIASDNAELVSEDVLDSDDNDLFGVLFGFFWVFIWFVIFSSLASGRKNHWLPWIIFTKSFRDSHRSSSNFGGSSSFGSNNFRNFGGTSSFKGGGGHFGGGGASGGW